MYSDTDGNQAKKLDAEWERARENETGRLGGPADAGVRSGRDRDVCTRKERKIGLRLENGTISPGRRQCISTKTRPAVVILKKKKQKEMSFTFHQ